MASNVRAELTKLARRPASWLLLGVAVTLGLLFNYLVPYLGSAGGAGPTPNSERGLQGALPESVVGNAVAGAPVFVGALALVLGVLTVGSEYSWSTWKSVLSQGPGRHRLYAAKVVAVLTATLVATLSLVATGAAAAVSIAVAEDLPVDWPDASAFVLGVAGGWLVTSMWAAFGVLLAVLLRSVALPIGLGLVWVLAVQNLVATLAAPLIDWVADLQQYLPGPNAGSLVASLGAGTDTPGVAEIVAAGQAAAVVGGYTGLFLLLGGWLLGRRDIT